jgi:hypothetical protein
MPNPDYSDNPSITTNYTQLEDGKFIEIDGDSRFPAISVVRVHYPDTTQAFPQNTITQATTSIEVFPKVAVLTYNVNQGDTAGLSVPQYDYVVYTPNAAGYAINSRYYIGGPTGTMVAGVSSGYTNTNVLTSQWAYYRASSYVN